MDKILAKFPVMRQLVVKFCTIKEKFNGNKHLRVGVPFIVAMCVAPTLLEKFVEIQFLFGKVGNADQINEEIMNKHGGKKSREEILHESYKEMIEDKKQFLENWEPVRVNRSWEEHDDTFKHYVTVDDLRLKD